VSDLLKWDVLRVLPPGVGHNKFAVCICPRRLWFFYINSKRPFGRKSAAAAIRLASFEATFLRQAESFLDVSIIIALAPEVVAAALADDRARCGPLLPGVRRSVIASTNQYNVLEPAHRAAVLDGDS
jgi:hypothetical protein